eukprot:8522211-Heterocapsa_arctica.AAC.1
MKEVLSDNEPIMKAQTMRDTSTTSHIASKKNMEIKLKHFIMNKLKKKVAADKSDKTVQASA